MLIVRERRLFPGSPVRTPEQNFHVVGNLGMQSRRHVAIGVERQTDRAVSEQVLNDLWMDSSRKQMGGSRIDALSRHGSRLTNAVRGHDSEQGLVTLDELERKLAAPMLLTDIPAILIKLGWWTPDDDHELPRQGYGFRPGMTPASQELYDSTRAWWVLSQPRAAKYTYAVAVYQGFTRGVWEIDQHSWRFSDSPARGRTNRRWAFEGRRPTPEVFEVFVGRLGRRVPALRPGGGAVFGTGSPIAYWPA